MRGGGRSGGGRGEGREGKGEGEGGKVCVQIGDEW